jgi:hypothetical protein
MTAHTRLSILAASLLIFCLSGCTPTVNSVTVTPGADVNLVNVQASISNAPAASMGTPVLRVASLADNPPVFHNVVGGFTQVNGPIHQKDGLVLPGGQFRIEVQQPYTPVFTTGTQTVSKMQDVTVPVPQGCFFFDGSAQGWTTDGFFEIQTSSPTDFGTRVPLCSGTSPVIGATGPNFPQPYTSPIPVGFRSLAASINPLINACFSQPSPAPQSGLVVIDFISPNLSTVPGWATANGFDLQAKGLNLSGAPNEAPMRIQLLLQDTTGTFFRPENAQQQPTFTDLGAAFAAASFVRANTTLSQIRVRLFVPRMTNFPPETEVDIDRICPKTAP